MKKLKIILFTIFIIVIMGINSVATSNENEEVSEEYPFTIGKVTAESLKIRSGLSTENAQIGWLSKGDSVHIYGKVDNWYLIKTQDNLVGAVFSDFVEESYESQETIQTSANVEKAEMVSDISLSQEEQIFFNLINNKRIEKNLPEFELDECLLNMARLKAKDIVEKKYFSHTSPTYGTIFEMLQNQNISYNKASENIARNLNAEGAVQALMNSEAHKNNILSQDFNYTGISVVNSPEYGKIFVEIFLSK